MSDATGALRARVHLLRPIRTLDDLGGAAITWSDEGAVWAEIAPLSVREDAAFDVLRGRAFHRVSLRKPNEVRAGWRLQWGSRVFRVIAVRDSAPARAELECEEIL